MHQETPENQERTRRLIEAFTQRYGQDLEATAAGEERLSKMLEASRTRSGCPAMVVRAPGRVNLIGEHTDYNDGFVLPIAIDHDVRLAVCPRSDRIVRLYSLNFQSETVFDLDDVQRDEVNQWGNYARGMAVELTRAGYLLRGMDGVVEGNVPIASGLSSSAAMEIAAGMAFCVVSMQEVEPPCLAQLAQAAENNYMGVRSGIMDQFVSRMGHVGCALFLDCRSLQFELVPVPGEEYLFVVADSRQSRELAGSAYNERRAQCETAVAELQKSLPHVRALRDVSIGDLQRFGGGLDPVVYRRARHVVTENERVLRAVEALRGNDLHRFGRLMNESHNSLRDDYEVSSPALDTLVNAARDVDGCIGSRLTGAGFGGCTVSLVRQDRVDAFRKQVSDRYRQSPDAQGAEAQLYVTRPAPGAGLTKVQ
jgi:galactokinase